MNIVTAGGRFIDIDAYGGCIAYAELLTLQGKAAKAVSTAPWNESITAGIRSWKLPVALETKYAPSPDDTFTVIDVSDPEHFEQFIALDRVSEVIDHHPGFEIFWAERTGGASTIDFIGAACTLVFESWKAAGMLEKMSETSARLLIAGILDNTLNFGATLTTERDKAAYKELLPLAHLPAGWPAEYFTDCQEAILADVGAAIKNDSKLLQFQTYPDKLAVGQLVVWNNSEVLEKHETTAEATLRALNPKWFLNLINVGEKRSYFICKDPSVQRWLSDLLGIAFTGSVAAANHMWLRKEVIKQDLERTTP